MTDYPFGIQVAVSALDENNVVRDGDVWIYATTDVAGTTPLTLTDLTGLPLTNPLRSNGIGYTRAFITNVPQVKWKSGVHEGLFDSYAGMRDEAVQAKVAAQVSASSALESASLAKAPTDAQVDAGILRADVVGQISAQVPPLVAPLVAAQVPPLVASSIASDPTIANAAATMAQSTAGLVPVWKANTAYAINQKVIAPNGDVVTAKVAFTSGAAYSAANWNPSAQDGRLGTVENVATLINQTAVFNGDKRLARTTSNPNYAFAWSDKNGRTPFGIRTDGSVEAAGGIDTPRAGKNLGTVNGLSWAVTSPGGVISEFSLGLDGCVPGWVLSRWAARMGVVPAPVRTAGFILTAAGNTSTPDTATSAQIRLPFKLGADATIRAVHFRNYNDRSGLAYPGSLSFAGVYFGTHALSAVGELTGNFTAAPTQLAGASTTPTDASEYKIGGLSIPLTAGTDYLLSYGYTGPAQENHSAVGGCWRNSTPADASAATATQTIQQFAPLDVWLEIEVAGNVPVIAYMGDSLSCGVASQLPVYHSYPMKHAQMNGHIPVMYTHSGSAMTSWTSAGVVKYTKWAAFTKPDALVFALGKNDVPTAVDTATMRARFAAIYPVMSAQISKNLYLTTVTPDANDSDAVGQLRRDWNAILKSELLGNAVAVFDFSAAVSTPAGGLDPTADSGDGKHLNKGGYVRTAMAINQPLHR